jgi:hypothetical protein
MSGMPPIPHHQLEVGDIVRWVSPERPENVHRWRILGIYLGGLREESLVEMECLTHLPGHTAAGRVHPTLVVSEVLVRGLLIEDVGDEFGVPSARRLAT